MCDVAKKLHQIFSCFPATRLGAQQMCSEWKTLNTSSAFEAKVFIHRLFSTFIENGQLKGFCTSFQRLFLPKCKNYSIKKRCKDFFQERVSCKVFALPFKDFFCQNHAILTCSNIPVKKNTLYIIFKKKSRS